MADPFASSLGVFFDGPGGEAIAYAPAIALADPLLAIRSEEDAVEFPGLKHIGRIVTFEIRQSNLSRRPQKGDQITHDGRAWSIIQVKDRDDVRSWIVAVEKAVP